MTRAAAVPEVAVALLRWEDGFLLQLRDNDPGIRAPYQWGFFGGHLEPGETPEAAILRELVEELSYEAPSATPFGVYPDTGVLRHAFVVPLNVPPDTLTLGEGLDLQVLGASQIRCGEAWSPREKTLRPIIPGIQAILLEFLNGRKIP